jgi:3-phosphoshikimate 1-carboxyvinyltransferase
MTDFLAIPPAREVRGEVRVPPSKSATNRALVLAALSEAPVEIAGLLDSDDTRALVRCLEAMGASVAPSPQGLVVSGPLGRRGGEEVLLDAGDSGTAARFLAAVAATTSGTFLLTGSRRLRERPMEELVSALRAGGARIDFREKEGRLPVVIGGESLRSGKVAVNASRSSQFLSALLLAGVAVPGGLEVLAEGSIASAPYVDQTLDALAAFGHDVKRRAGIRITRGAKPPGRYDVPGDYSSAVPLLAAAGVLDGEVRVTGLAWPSSDADAGALPVLEKMGVGITAGRSAVTARALAGSLAATDVSATDFPDSVPALAALAAFAPGKSRFRGIAHLRWKESDRIHAIAQLLSAVGASCSAGEDELVVEGNGALLRARSAVARLPTFGDHRIAMAAALLCLGAPGCLIENPGCVAKSYPGFFRDLESIAVR